MKIHTPRYIPDSKGPSRVNLNSSKVSVPPVPQCLALGLQMLPANRKRASGSWLHPPINTGSTGSFYIFKVKQQSKTLQEQILEIDISTVCFVRKVEPKSVSKSNFRAREEDAMSWNSGI